MRSPTTTDSLGPAVAEAPAGRGLSALTPTSWEAGRELAIGEWVEQGRCLGTIGRGSGWWIGDWLRYGSAVRGLRAELRRARQRSAARLTLAKTRLDGSGDALRAHPDRRSDPVVCPQCGHSFAR